VRRRFFVDGFDQNTNSAVLEGEAAHHLGHVLRAQPGQLYELSDGSAAWLARIESVRRDRVDFALLEPIPAIGLVADLTLLLSIVKFDAFEWALEKATELGVSTIVPLAAGRSEKNLVGAAAKRAERWRKILFESSQQSRRLRLPVLAETAGAMPAFAQHVGKLCFLFSERSDAPPLRRVLAGRDSTGPRSAVLAIGPEGGWTDDEFAAAGTAGFREASLGPLILRTETAVVSAISVLNFHWTAVPDQPEV
jgi:16S rRNA (uracil1498-N3)-methyltransferase